VKRRDLVRMIADAARARAVSWEFVREGAEHEIWAIGSRAFSIPRHRELREQTARAILKATEKELGERWWEP
jgi:hypothetical protein